MYGQKYFEVDENGYSKKMSFEEAKNCWDDFIKENNELSNEDKNQIHSLYKQATVGDINTKRPLIEGKQQYDSWK